MTTRLFSGHEGESPEARAERIKAMAEGLEERRRLREQGKPVGAGFHQHSPDTDFEAWVEELERAPAIAVAAYSLNDDFSRGDMIFAAASDGERLCVIEARPGAGKNVAVKFGWAREEHGQEVTAAAFVRKLQYNWTYVSWETCGHHSYGDAVAHAAELFAAAQGPG